MSLSPAITPTWAGAAALEHWELLVIGDDLSGLQAALEAADFQGRVGLIEQRIGQSKASTPVRSRTQCANAYAQLLSAARSAAGSSQPVAWPFTKQLVESSASSTNANSVSPTSSRFELVPLAGWSVFTGPHTLAVHGREIAFHRAILATGSRDDRHAIKGLEETGFITPETVDQLAELPKRVAVLGSGAGACELAQALRLLGSDVSLVCEEAQLLPREEPAAAAMVTRALESLGVRLQFGWRCLSTSNTGRAKSVLSAQGEEQRKLIVDQIVLALQRRANLERLGLEAAGIRSHERDGRPAIQVDSRLATTNPRVFAVGEVCAGERGLEALRRMCSVAVQNAVGVARPRFDKSLVPRVVATHPQVAQIGLTSAEARARHMEVDTWLVPFHGENSVPRQLDGVNLEDAITTEPACREFALMNMVRDQPERVAGATMVGSQAAESLALVSMLMAEELPLSTLTTIPTLPVTAARALAQLGEIIERNSRAKQGRAGRRVR